jgi:uncharacterized protein (DUF736 family)
MSINYSCIEWNGHSRTFKGTMMGKRNATAKAVDVEQMLNESGNGKANGLGLDASTRSKFVLFAIPVADRVEEGPVMRGLLETEQGKINVAGWKRVARESGKEYLSLKVGNTKPRELEAPADAPDEWLVGPFYGRLFKEVSSTRDGERTRYFGFIEHSEKVGEDAHTLKGIYKTHWQVQIKARPNVSNDGRTHYIDGTANPAGAKAETADAGPMPF